MNGMKGTTNKSKILNSKGLFLRTCRAKGEIELSKEELNVVEEEVVEEVNDEEVEETKTYTEEELQKLLQSETDRKVSKALETAKSKWEQEYEQKLEAEKSEAEKLASMSAEERAKAEFEREKEEWLKEKSKFEKEKMKLEATKLLNSEGLPITFVDYVVGDTAEDVQENIKVFKEEWTKSLDEAVTERLKGRTPSGSALQSKDIAKMTKAEFGKLPYKERERMLKVDPDIVSKLKD